VKTFGNFSEDVHQVQSMTWHKDIRMVVKYNHERGNLEENAINFLHYDETAPAAESNHCESLRFSETDLGF